jgi:hypothetical protein
MVVHPAISELAGLADDATPDDGATLRDRWHGSSADERTGFVHKMRWHRMVMSHVVGNDHAAEKVMSSSKRVRLRHSVCAHLLAELCEVASVDIGVGLDAEAANSQG